MKKKILALALFLSIIVGVLYSCKTNPKNLISDISSIDSVSIENEISNMGNISEKPTESTPSKATSGSSTTNSIWSDKENEFTSSQAESVMPTVPVSVDVQVEETIITDEEIEEPVNVENVKEMEFINNHISVSENDYYQYNTLNAKEKMLYKSIVNTVSRSGSVVNTLNLAISYDNVVSVFQKVLTDYPQYFYISRSCILIYASRGDNIRAIVLLYTDGIVTDEYDENMKLIQTADRSLINQKINRLQSETEKVISKIPAEISDIIKEKRIHDYVVETVSYDYSVIENIDNFTTMPHDFDLYGAMVEGSAVCEGYSKLFQFICYCVGINSTQVVGTSGGGNHMWNAVLIDQEWYQIDVTWNDTEKIISYSYFNLTNESISKDHIIDSSVIAVPQCNSTENSFISTFAVCVTDLNKAPTNYESAIANIKEAGDKRVYIYIEGYELDRIGVINLQKYSRYIQQYLLRTTSDFYAYISKQGLSLSGNTYKINEFIVLTLR